MKFWVVKRMAEPAQRASVPALDAVLGQAFPVLDQGFVRVVDYMGDDAAVVQAARVSYGKGTKSARDDAGLIRYLMRHRHTTPFEMCEIKFHIKLPIFVARQWVRHRTANINEISARYSVLDSEFYVPDAAQVASQSQVNHQGRGEALSPERAEDVRDQLDTQGVAAFALYESLLEEPVGLTRELARTVLPLSAYTQWYWKTDLHNLLHFLALRADPHAQYEIRVYAERMLELVERWVPLSCQAFRDYRLDGFTLSGPMRRVLSQVLRGEIADPEAAGLSSREWRELCAALNLDP